MRKYIILFLLWGVFGNAQYNLFARQNFAKSISAPTFNTYIGGVSGTIATASALATKLGISVGAISNFTVVGSDIKCKITGSYAIPTSAFQFNATPCTYYIDSDYLVTSLGSNAFYFTNITGSIDFQNATSASDAFNATPLLTEILLKSATSVANSGFAQSSNGTRTLKTCYIPNVTSLGSTSGDNSVFTGNCIGLTIYAHPSLQTNNAGGVDGDLAYAISNGATVRYVTNFTAPSAVTTLAAGTVYNTAIQLNFTPPSGTNAIDYYECYINGVFKNNISASGGYVTGLTEGTSYDVTVYARDIFYNKSLVSNTLTQSTDNYSYTDADANASISAKSLTGSEQESEYLLITGLKSNSLYTKCQAVYTFKGTTAAQHKFNSKNPLDTDAAFRLTFTGAATFSNLGYQLNGSSYANTYFTPSAQQTLNSNGMTLICGTNNAAASSDVIDIGVINASGYSFLAIKNNSSFRKVVGFNANQIIISSSDESRGIFTGTKQSATITDAFFNGTQIATANCGGNLPTISAFIGAVNLNGSPYGYSNQRIQMVIFHDGLSDTEVTTMHSIIDLSETIAGRKTW